MTISPRIPEPEGLGREFYDQAASGTLHIQQCTNCGQMRHPPRHLCAVCFSPDYAWTPSPGRGTLFSWTVTHFPFDRGWAEALPYATLVVELEEGVRMIGAFGADDLSQLRLDLPLLATLECSRHGFPFLSFTPR